MAFLESFKDVFSKELLKTFNPFVFVVCIKILSFILLLPTIFVPFTINDLTGFSLVYSLDVFLNFVSLLLYFSALKHSPISLSVPMITFSPVLLLITSRIMLGERVSIMGMLGVFMVFLGSYILNISKAKAGFFEPIKAIFKERGSRYMLTVALIWSITANLDKIGVKLSSPLIWPLFMSGGIGFLGLVLLKVKGEKVVISKKMFLVSIADSSGAVSQMVAVSLTLVPYVISIKRLSVLFSSLWGIFVLREGANFWGIILMVLGAVIITLFG